MKRFVILTGLLALGACGEQTTAGGDAAAPASQSQSAAASSTPEERGRRQFNECAVCHTAKQGEANRVGPNLFGIYGSEAAQVEGFAYSSALSESGLVWNEENLDAFIENPPAFLRGNRMAYAGQRDAQKRADIIAYLKTLR